MLFMLLPTIYVARVVQPNGAQQQIHLVGRQADLRVFWQPKKKTRISDNFVKVIRTVICIDAGTLRQARQSGIDVRIDMLTQSREEMGVPCPVVGIAVRKIIPVLVQHALGILLQGK
ncbi:MAG: hypothetical protein CVU30_17980 [Betaproteobacteria bacterium HGW-Betaproteobacteria-3]|nr:MAG: hypothetical protein CVU30_17980 [Betaproteobacteria bacterium HGW-Betaproteobacteria-3]